MQRYWYKLIFNIYLILYVYNTDEEFRKIEPDIKERIFSGFNISIRKMQCINTIPNYIIND